MRYLFTLPFLFITSILLSQSSTWCGTVLPESYKQEYAAKDRSHYSEWMNQRAGIRYVPVFYHIVAKSDGSGGASLQKIFESHCLLNEAYNPFDIGFFIEGIDTIKNTTLWNYQNQYLGYQAFNQYNEPNVCNVYVNGNLPGLCGFATFPNSAPNGGGLFLNADCLGAGTATLPHEMGHYLGLLHTFETSYGVEYVDSSNCNTAGDLFCDTPADFVDYRAACPYTGDSTDPHGDLYRTVIDESLYMSYFYDNCVNRFSPMQQAEMNNTLSNDRANLLNQATPDLSALPVTTFVQPQDGDTTLIAGNSQTFIWNTVPGAKYYIFKLQSATSSLMFADTLVSDTSFTIANLSPNKVYKFRAQAVSYGNACSNFTPDQLIATSTIKTNVTVVTPTCAGDVDGQILLTPMNGTAPYSLSWSNGSTADTLTNLAPGMYTVTITDASGEVATQHINVADPGIVNITINRVGGNLNAYGNGGTPPYTYHWSNGVNGQFNNNVGFGSYTVTVTDSKGCSNAETFVYSSIGIDPQLQAHLRLFPNPAEHSDVLKVQVDLNERTTAEVSLVNMQGKVLQSKVQQFAEGTNLMQFDITDLPSGIYLLQFKANEAVQSKRFSIIH